MERRRLEEMDPDALERFPNDWCLGSESFRKGYLEKMQDKVNDNHPGRALERFTAPNAPGKSVRAA